MTLHGRKDQDETLSRHVVSVISGPYKREGDLAERRGHVTRTGVQVWHRVWHVYLGVNAGEGECPCMLAAVRGGGCSWDGLWVSGAHSVLCL
jgi:hypothetical protein